MQQPLLASGQVVDTIVAPLRFTWAAQLGSGKLTIRTPITPIRCLQPRVGVSRLLKLPIASAVERVERHSKLFQMQT